MNEHLDLLELLRGELGNAATVAAGEHLAGCTACQEELAEAVVGHALLTRAGSTLGARPTVADLPPLPRPAVSRRPARRGLALAAAAALVVGAVGAGGIAMSRSQDSSQPTEIEAELSAVSGAGPEHGLVAMTESHGRTRMALDVDRLPAPTGDEFYYAWLLDPSTNKMLPLGQVDATSGATFDVPDALVASYSAVDVSLETDDGDPAHSVTSVLRGAY